MNCAVGCILMECACAVQSNARPLLHVEGACRFFAFVGGVRVYVSSRSLLALKALQLVFFEPRVVNVSV